MYVYACNNAGLDEEAQFIRGVMHVAEKDNEATLPRIVD
jgi:hypothetical protein